MASRTGKPRKGEKPAKQPSGFSRIFGEVANTTLVVRANGLGETTRKQVGISQPVGATGIRAQAGALDALVLNTDILGHEGRMVTQVVGIDAYESCEGLQLEVRGSTRWRLRAATLLLSAGTPVQRSPRL